MVRFYSSSIVCLIAFASANSQPIIVAVDGSGNFRTVQEAVNSIPDFNQSSTTIFIKNGVYKEKVYVSDYKHNITITGESRDSAIITWNDHARINNMGTFKTFTMYIGGENIKLTNLTIENNAEPLGQAVALHIEGTKISVSKCRLLGNQDTLFTGNESGYEYFENCYIEGTTDFIFGPATVWFENCLIHSKKNSYVTAASTVPTRQFGYIFNRCKLTANQEINKVYLGRPWRPYASVLFMHCELGNHIVPEGWYNWDKPEREFTVRYMEFENFGPGASVDKRVKWSRQLNNKEAKLYELSNVLPGWEPWK